MYNFSLFQERVGGSNLENKLTPKQQKRQQERELIEEYHKFVTEETLEPLYQSFINWKSGSLP